MKLPTKNPLAKIGHRRTGGLRCKPNFTKSLLLLLGACLVTGLSVPARAADTATVTFSLEFPNSDPERYSISVSSDGHAKYECSAKVAPESDERQSYESAFEFSPANRERIFALTAQAHYFAGKIDSGNHKLAFTGAKKLVYRDGERSSIADYNYSSLPAVQQLTALFQSVASTLEYGRRLAYYHRYQKLALDEELKRMEGQARSNELSELHAVEPLLQAISSDPSVMNVVRARAQWLIELGKKDASGGR